jgi:hypothetical protein
MLPTSVSGVVPIEQMRGDDPEDLELLRADFEKARSFLLNQTWCFGLGEVYCGEGIGGIMSIFLMELDPVPTGVDQWLWVIVGDIPSAYFVIDQYQTPIDALKGYIAARRRWVELAYGGETSPDVMPVDVPANPHYAEILERRLNILEKFISPKEEN